MNSYKLDNKIRNNRNSNKNNKKIIKNSTNSIKKHDLERIYKEFYDWLSGIQEDEPMPLEVNNVYFIVEFFQNDVAISYTGDENSLSIFDYGFYSPLEGQYFDCAILKQISNDVFVKKSISQNEVYGFIKNMVFSVAPKLWFIKDKQIFCGIRHNKNSV
ncbi:MAG TPA: hypothetical protein DCO89_00725 [Clostridiales bacterium]|nr:hypothetical protein [Clostridiales bacterium]